NPETACKPVRAFSAWFNIGESMSGPDKGGGKTHNFDYFDYASECQWETCPLLFRMTGLFRTIWAYQVCSSVAG
ncbi:hypothetical protein ACQP3C_29515, partial [Escherichia coli]